MIVILFRSAIRIYACRTTLEELADTIEAMEADGFQVMSAWKM